MSYNKKQDFERFRKIIREKDFEIASLKQKINHLEVIVEKDFNSLLSTVNSTPALIYNKDLDGKYLFINQTYSDYFKIGKKDIIGKSDFELFEGETAKNMFINDNKIKFENKTLQFEEELVINEKTKIFLSVKSPLKKDNGEIIGISGISIDITDRVRILTSLFEREGLLRTVIESATDPIFVKDTKLYYKRINHAMEKLTGKNRAFVLGKKDEDLFDTETINYLQEGDISVLGGSRHEKHFTKNVNGETQYLHLIKVPLQDSLGNVTGICGVIRDITKTKEAELKSSLLAKVVEQVGECIVVADLDGIIEYANPAFEEITGYSVEEALGRNPRFLQSGEHDKDFYIKLWETLSSGETWRGVFHNKRKNGTLYYENAVIFPVKNNEGETLKYAAVKMGLTFLDIIESIKSEKLQF